ncbi:hypothetical protein EG028_25230 [Chitinophaga barathri]|uniref:Uncharacterized protein n=1 Tax=Chitinophaga barathri TaxID=1647451 RepID=A0A3N4M5V0_9BACT|nr:hypothetical protein EG028_25230 [Chitinophaga barathri]
MPTNITQRLVIYPRDIMDILGLSESSARRYLKQLKKTLGKSEHHFITVMEFCLFSGISIEEIRANLS